MSSFDRLIAQIDAFIRKFYKNQIIKGLILFVGVLLFTYLSVITLEYFGRFNSYVRGGLFFGFLAVNIVILIKYILIPTLRLQSFGKRIDRYQASKIIGKFFPTVSDRLLNTLQLQDRMDPNSADYELLNASVQQRSSTMSTIPFVNAINIGENKRYVAWVTPIVLIMFAIGVFSPDVLTDGTERVVNFNEEFEIEAPFDFTLSTALDDLEEGEDFAFELVLEGENLPDKVYVKSKQGKFLLKRKAKNKFVGSLVQVRDAIDFAFEANYKGNVFRSESYHLDVIGKTAIGKMQATLIYPGYLGKDNEVVENAADLTVPEGTKIKWSVLTKNSEGVDFWINDKKRSFDKDGFSVTQEFLRSSEGAVVLTNRLNQRKDTTAFSIDVVKDEYPSIQVEEVQDTLKDGIRYFSGLLNDDHGLAGLKFVYTITTKDGESRTERMDASKVFGTESPFDFAVDFRKENVQLEDQIEYYFVVFDNDGVNGSKSTKSRTFVYELPSLEELNEQRSEEQEQIKDDLKSALEKAEKFKKDLDHLRKEMNDSKRSNWNQENQVNQLQEEHKSLLEDLQSLQENIENSQEEKNQLSEMDEELMEQQDMINDLLEELMDDELKDLLEQLEDLMKEQNQEQLEENLEQLEMSSEDMKNQLDRSLEMLKRLQVNERIDDIEEELKELSDRQEELANEVKEGDKITEEQKAEQDAIDKAFEEVMDDIREMDSLNQELNNPMDLGNPEEMGEQVQEELDNAGEKMEKGKNGQAGESQQNASDQMQQMADQMNEMQQQANQQQQQEDMAMLRNILESLVHLSVDQEAVMQDMKRISNRGYLDPAFGTYSRIQRRIVDDTKIVRDSLYELAKRQPKIAKFIDKELNSINKNHELTLWNIEESQVDANRRSVPVNQQYVMTSYNNLALMLNESLQDMQNQMRSQQPGSGSCNKPGGKGVPKPGNGMSSQDMKQMLKKQLEQMKKGQQEGGKKPGDKPGEGQKPGSNGQGGMLGMGNKQIAKMAAEQNAIRKRLEQLRKELNKDGSGNGNRLNPLIKELEEQERELVNKRLNDNMVQRQKEILTRLLESEKALMERGLEEKRESKSGKNENYGNQIRFDEYNKEKLRQIELLRAVDPSYKKYYKDRANEYFNRVL